jgi:nucleotide-binding universal stress UspA family protein
MTVLHSNIAPARKKDARAPQRTARPKPTLKILAAVDGSESTNGVVEYLTARGAGSEIVILNVQTKSDDWRLRGYGSFKEKDVNARLIDDLGRPIVRGVGRRFQKAGLPHRERVEIGDPAETIIRCAAEEGCDLIVVGDPRPGPLRRWITRTAGVSFGSVASDVVQLAGVPVVIAK